MTRPPPHIRPVCPRPAAHLRSVLFEHTARRRAGRPLHVPCPVTPSSLSGLWPHRPAWSSVRRIRTHARARASECAPPRLRLRADTHQSLRPADEARWTSAPSVCASAPPASCSAAGVGQLLYARATPSWCVLSIETETDWSPKFFEWNYACAFGLLYGIDHLLSHMERSTERWLSELWIRVQAAPSWHRPAFTQNLQSSPCAGARDVAVTEAGASPGLDIGGC